MRVLVCGGRHFNDYAIVKSTLDKLDAETPIDVVLEGGARGADYLGFRWAQLRLRGSQSFPANWALGRKAGPIRNRQMLEDGQPDVVVAFPGGKGTADMIKQAKARGVRVIEVK